jgi:hypothetical protein
MASYTIDPKIQLQVATIRVKSSFCKPEITTKLKVFLTHSRVAKTNMVDISYNKQVYYHFLWGVQVYHFLRGGIMASYKIDQKI